MWAEKKRKRPHEWLEGVLGVLELAPSINGYNFLKMPILLFLNSHTTVQYCENSTDD
jgi:hypothetical protein